MASANNFRKHFNAIREKNKITFSELSDLTGINRVQLNRYALGENSPGFEQLDAIAKGLGVSVSALIGDETPEAAPPRKPTPEELAIEMLRRFGVSETKLAKIERILRD
ncbi:MAG: helix-turn-helix domain-containing protein [Bdellovibrionota bacterium]